MGNHARQVEAKPIYSLMAIMFSPCQMAKEWMVMFQDIYTNGGNKPCHGCLYFKNGHCPDYPRLSQVQPDFERRIMEVGMENIGLLALSAALATEKNIKAGFIPITLHLLTAENPLVLQQDGNIWDKLKALFPAEGGGIDIDKLGDAITAKLQELGLLKV